MAARQNRIFDKSQYDARTISTYNVIGAYIVDMFYNYFYAEAMKLKAMGKTTSVTEGYKETIGRFLSVIDNRLTTYRAEHFTRLLTQLNAYFSEYTSFETFDLSDFIDRVTEVMVPPKTHKQMNKEQKRTILRNALVTAYNNFTVVVMEEYLVHIIDNHNDSTNIEALKDRILDIFLFERETMYQKFIDCRTGRAAADKVDKSLVLRIQQAYRLSQAENTKLATELADKKKKCEVIEMQLRELFDKYKNVVRRYRSVCEENANLKKKNRWMETVMEQSRIAEQDDDYDEDTDQTEYQPSQYVNYSAQPIEQRVSPARVARGTIPLHVDTERSEQEHDASQENTTPKSPPAKIPEISDAPQSASEPSKEEMVALLDAHRVADNDVEPRSPADVIAARKPSRMFDDFMGPEPSITDIF